MTRKRDRPPLRLRKQLMMARQLQDRRGCIEAANEILDWFDARRQPPWLIAKPEERTHD